MVGDPAREKGSFKPPKSRSMNHSSDYENQQLDEIQESFRKAWEEGGNPEIVDFLADSNSDNSFREKLLKALIPIDIEFRVMAGEEINSGHYEDFGIVAQRYAADFFSISDTPGPNDVTWNAENDEVYSISESSSHLEKKVVAGKYKLIHEIGAGGMGTVWLAQQEQPVRRQVALKVIRTAIGSKENLIRFEAERQALAMMNHPNIAQVLDAGTMEDGSPFFVMELVKGKPFTQYCNENRLTIRKRLELLIPVCLAVQHAHQKGIIHRDIKPSNILVSLQADVPTPKVIDFGLAKAQENQTRLTEETMMTEYGQVLGTLQYMSPEQAGTNNLDIDARTDIFSLGVVMYQLLTSTTPLDRKTIAEHTFVQVIDKICRSDLQRPSERLTKSTEDLALVAAQRQTDPRKLIHMLEGELDWIALKALERDRAHRYQTAKDLADEIQRYLDNEPVIARPPSRTYLFKKFVRKNRGLVASIFLAVGLLVAGTVTSTYFALQANFLQKRANRQLGVYKDLFASANPFAGAKKNLSTGQMLENAEQDVLEKFEDDPIGKAELLHEIGKSYHGQSYTDNAISTLENALSIQKLYLGPKALPTLDTQESLAIAYASRDVDRMLNLMRGVYEGRKRQLDHNCDEMMNARHLYATAAFVKYKEDKKKDKIHPELINESINIFEENFQSQLERLGPEHENTLKTQTNLANAYLKNDQVIKSIQLAEDALAGWQKVVDKSKSEKERNIALSHYLTTKNNYAEALEKDNQIDRAIDVFLETLDQKADRYDIGHDIWQTTLRLVLRAMIKSGQVDRAQKFFDTQYQKIDSTPGFHNKETVINKLDQMKASLFATVDSNDPD